MRKFAHIKNNTVVNIFDWKEERNPDLGKNNLLLDITEFAGEVNIGDTYDGKGFLKPVEVQPEKEKTILDKKRELLDMLDELRDKINRL